MSARTKTVEYWTESRLVINFGNLRYQVPYLTRINRVNPVPVPALLASKFKLATQKIFEIPRRNGEWAGTDRKSRLDIAPIWRWIQQIQGSI